MGAILGLGILLVRRHVPESPRWLFIHGREAEAERIVREIEAEVQAETGRDLPEPDQVITVRQRDAIPFREIARYTVRRYPRRAILGLSLFIGQAFLYNAVTFDLGTILHTFFAVGTSSVPYFMVLFALSNFMGPLLLGRLFDTVGRIPMISGTYLGSAVVVVVLALLLRGGTLTTWSFMALVMAAFFFASAGASSAYLTVSEVFPMEMRALAIALFYAIGTAVGGITGPVLFGQFIHSGNPQQVATGFFIGAAAMAVGGVTELLFGVRAEQRSLEDIAQPLTAAEAEAELPPEPIEPRTVTGRGLLLARHGRHGGHGEPLPGDGRARPRPRDRAPGRRARGARAHRPRRSGRPPRRARLGARAFPVRAARGRRRGPRHAAGRRAVQLRGLTGMAVLVA
jgi:hypothetical protein